MRPTQCDSATKLNYGVRSSLALPIKAHNKGIGKYGQVVDQKLRPSLPKLSMFVVTRECNNISILTKKNYHFKC